jgi:phosphoglycerol transferase MdoB-like AlkP superfamily enzyme
MTQFFSALKSRTSPYLYWFLFLHFMYLFQIHSVESMGGFYFNFKGILLIFLSFVPAACLFYMFNYLFSKSKKRIVFGNVLLICFYGLLAAYHFHSETPFEWMTFKDNVANAFYVESVIFMWNSLNKDVFNYVIVLLSILAGMEWKYASISRYKDSVNNKGFFVRVLLVYFIWIFSALPCYDPISSFFKSIVVYYFKSDISVNYKPNSYPLVKQTSDQFYSVNLGNNKPNIFLIVVESLNKSVIHKKTSDGVEVTPFLNRLEQNSLVVEHFYANSIQSARGYTSIFLSIIPSMAEKITTKYKKINTISIGNILNDKGYKSVMFHAYQLNNFDNGTKFFGARGFSMKSVKPYVKEEDSTFVWRDWGPEDNVFFKRFFDYYDKELSGKGPNFVSLITIASHFPFNSVPEHRRLLYKQPKNIHEEYENSLHLVDNGIRVFFDELKKRDLFDNSIVIITSDHTIPMGEHGIYHQEAGYYDESFRVPLYIHWPKGLKPGVIKGRPFSQVDIAPTILDLIDVDPGVNHMMGHSIFNPILKPVFLIQPYGRHLSVLLWPYKFIWHGNLGTTEVFNLKDDPLEQYNIVNTISDQKKDQFKQELVKIYLQRKLYEEDAVFPR